MEIEGCVGGFLPSMALFLALVLVFFPKLRCLWFYARGIGFSYKGVVFMFKHILVPVDGSATSMQAVSKAAGMAKAFGSEVTAVYVLDPYPFTGVGADFAYGQAQYLSAATNEANKALEDVKKLLDEAGVTSTTLVGEGHAIHEGIVRVGENVGADLIVMGSHGRRGLEKLVLGSVAQRVLQAAHVPVLVVRA
jgi:nucleotide-binding universal stress UspA family protein